MSIHLVDSDYDQGTVLAQCHIPVYSDDAVTTLSQRVLEREHTFLVEILQKIVIEEILLQQTKQRDF